MKDIIYMTFLGIVAGMIAILWTRLIRKNMLFRKLGKWLEIQNNRHLINHTCDSMLVKLVRCSFCLSVWLVLMLEVFYIFTYSPWWLFAIIGIAAGLGAGNFTCEVINALRNEV